MAQRQAMLDELLAVFAMNREELDELPTFDHPTVSHENIIAMSCWRMVELDMMEYVGDGRFRLVE